MSSSPLYPIDFSSFSSVLILKQKRKKKTPHLSLLLLSIISKLCHKQSVEITPTRVVKLVITKGYAVPATTIRNPNAFAPSLWQIVKQSMIILREVEGWNVSDQIAFCDIRLRLGLWAPPVVRNNPEKPWGEWMIRNSQFMKEDYSYLIWYDIVALVPPPVVYHGIYVSLQLFL